MTESIAAHTAAAAADALAAVRRAQGARGEATLAGPEPLIDVPVRVAVVLAVPVGTVVTVRLLGVAGGGALSRVTRTPHVSSALVYSCTVYIVMSSLGSMLVYE